MMRSACLKYYKRPEIRDALLSGAENREVAVKYGDVGFGRRPEVIENPEDVLEFAKRGATSFHCSEERWINPLAISLELKKKEVDEMRKGWDLVLDIDGWFPLSKIAAKLVIEALKFHDIRTLSVKFSGNKGFHIGIPFESFPEMVHGKMTSSLFPEGPRKIASYLKSMIKTHLSSRILEKYSLREISENTGISQDEMTEKGQFNPFSCVDIDTILISSRHLYRMAYSYHEKSGLVSIPIIPEELDSFEREMALPENIVPDKLFLADKPETAEASSLILQAFDADVKIEEYEKARKTEYDEITEAIPESCFPPCIKLIKQGLKDGKKRALFAAVNFLSSVGWDYDSIEKWLNEWNKNNQEPLREVLIKGQLRYHKQQKKSILPPNCSNDQYYVSLGVCKPDNLCPKICNPVSYARRRAFFLQNEKGKGGKDKE